MARRLNFTEFAEFLLLRLYELDDGEFLDADEIARELEEPVPGSWPFDAIKLLHDRGLVHDGRTMGPTSHAAITGEGRVAVEELAREADSIVREYRERPANLVIITGQHHQVSVGNEGDTVQVKPALPAADE